MKDRINYTQVRTLLRKQIQERGSAYRKGNFDFFGFLIHWVLLLVFLAVFIIFFGRFTDIYLSIKTNGLVLMQTRLFELLSMAYMLILLFLVISGVGQINRQLFDADDIKLLMGMPVGARTIFMAKLISIYFGQLIISVACVLAINITVAMHVPQTATYYAITALFCFVLPLISLAISALAAMPYHAVKQLLKDKFILHFLLITLVTAALFYVYSIVLGAVRDMLLDDSLRYFFNEQVMAVLQKFTRCLYPAIWFSNILLGRNLAVSWSCLAALTVVCLVIAGLVIRRLMKWVMQSRIAGNVNFIHKKSKVKPASKPFWALIKKDFLLIFRTPAYTFSYFSIAVIMPLMVYFCITVGSSIIIKLIGINCNFEIAIFLTLLFGALTNVFCSTNISREGEMFFSIKAYSVDYKQVFFSKITLCMMVAAISQLISALVLLLTGYVGIGEAALIFVSGLLCSFAQICFATRYDFNHAKFSTEEDGEIKESGSTVSVIIVLGMITSFLIGGSVLMIRLMFALRFVSGYGYLTYLIVGLVSAVIAALSFVYLIHNLKQKYRTFSGGGQF